MLPELAFDDAPGAVTVDLAQLLVSRLLIQANSGGGKSWALRWLLEQTHGKVQQLIIDPEGEFVTLRERFDYVVIGKDGDLDVPSAQAGELCERLMELQVSAVLDLYDKTLAERRAFVRVFLDRLINLPRPLWRPLLVVIDEAHLFAPQQGESEATEAVISLCTRGRKRPFAAILATQRLAKLHKDATADLLNVLIGRTELDIDQQRAGDKLGFDRAARKTLAQLEPGVFYAYGPAISRGVVQVRTGAVQTTHPKPGALVPPTPPAPQAIQRLLGQLTDLPQPTVADTQLRTAQRRVAALERQLAEARAAQPPIDQAWIDAFAAGLSNLTNLAEQFGQLMRQLPGGAEQAVSELKGAQNGTHAEPVVSDVERLLEQAAVQAKIRSAQLSIRDGADAYVTPLLRTALQTPVSASEIVEAWGLRGQSTLGRVRRAGKALVAVNLLIVQQDGRWTANRVEFERLTQLAASVPQLRRRQGKG